MGTYFEIKSDYIPYSFNQQDFYVGLKKICDSNLGQWYSSSKGLKVVSTVRSWAQSFFGWLGFSNRTSLPNIEYGLLKMLYYGYTQDFMRYGDQETGMKDDIFRNALHNLTQKTQNAGFSTTLQNVFDLISKQPTYVFSERTRKDLADHLTTFEAVYREQLAPLGSPTKIPRGFVNSFGSTPIALARYALKNRKVGEAIEYAESAYNLLIENKYDSIGDLFLHIASTLTYPHPTVVTRLEQFLQTAQNLKQHERALAFYQALDHLTPEIERETNPQVLLEYGRCASRSNQIDQALNFFTKAEDRGLMPAVVQQEKGKIYLNLAESAVRSNDIKKAIRLYELAAEIAIPIEPERLGELYIRAADEVFQNPPAIGSWFWKHADYSEAIDLYEKGIAQYKKANKLADHILVGNWFSQYLRAARAHNQLPKSIHLLNILITQYIQATKEPTSYHHSSEERLAHIKNIRSIAIKATELLQVAIQAEPENGEHYFKLANLYDYLNYCYDAYDSLPLFQKAFECDPDNVYYIVSAQKTYWSQSKKVPRQITEAWCRSDGMNRQAAEMWYENERWDKNQDAGRLRPIY